MRTIRAKLETASWLAWLALVGPLFALSNMAPAQAQTWVPSFVLVVSGNNVSITSNQTFDYGATPPVDSVTHSPGVTVQLHNGPNPECLFSASSSAGDVKYVSIGGSNGYDSANHYTDPPSIALRLPVPMRWTLNLNCQSAGVVTAIVSTEAPPPSPACPCGPIPGGPLPTTPAPPPPPPAPKPVPVPVVPKPAPKPVPPPVRKVDPPVLAAAATPAVVVQTATATPTPSTSPSPSPTSRPSPSPTRETKPSISPSHLAEKKISHSHGFPLWVIAIGGVLGAFVAFAVIRRRRDSWG